MYILVWYFIKQFTNFSKIVAINLQFNHDAEQINRLQVFNIIQISGTRVTVW